MRLELQMLKDVVICLRMAAANEQLEREFETSPVPDLGFGHFVFLILEMFCEVEVQGNKGTDIYKMAHCYM